MGRNKTSTVAGASLFLAVTGILGRGIGFFREILFAGFFGLKSDFDIYLVGAVLPLIINTAVLYLAQNYFIPAYHKCMINGREKGVRFFNFSLRNFFLFSAAVTLILFFFRESLIHSYLWNSSSEIRHTALKVFEIYLITIPLNSVYGILYSFLQTEMKFKHPALSQLLVNLIVIAFVLILTPSWGIYSIPAGYLAANLIQMIYLLIICRNELRLSFMSGKLWGLGFKTGGMIWIIVLIELVNQMHTMIDRYFFNFVDEGGIASLNYAVMIYSLPISIFSMAVSTAIFPVLSGHYAKNNMNELESYYNRALGIIVLLFIPITMVFYFAGDEIIRLLYQRGKFLPGDTMVTARVLRMYSISLVFYAAYAVINKMLYSTGMIKQLLFLSLLIICIKIAANFLLVGHYLQYGLALSTSLAYILIALSSYFLINYKLKFRNKFPLLKDIIFFGTAGVISFTIAFLLAELFEIPAIIEVFLILTLASGLYFFTVRQFDIEAVNVITSSMKGIIGRLSPGFRRFGTEMKEV